MNPNDISICETFDRLIQ